MGKVLGQVAVAHRMVVGGLMVIVMTVVLWLLLRGPSSGADLGSLPEAQLRFPASESLSEGSRNRVGDVLGTTSAAWWMILGTDASTEEVYRFYEAELIDRGWDWVGTQRSSSEIQAFVWQREGLRFRLGFKDTEEWHQRLSGSERIPTLYEIRLIERVPS